MDSEERTHRSHLDLHDALEVPQIRLCRTPSAAFDPIALHRLRGTAAVSNQKRNQITGYLREALGSFQPCSALNLQSSQAVDSILRCMVVADIPGRHRIDCLRYAFLIIA
jgi:hypothetical protein